MLGGHGVLCGMFSGISCLCPPDTSSMTLTPGWDSSRCLQMLPYGGVTPWGPKHPQVTTWLRPAQGSWCHHRVWNRTPSIAPLCPQPCWSFHQSGLVGGRHLANRDRQQAQQEALGAKGRGDEANMPGLPSEPHHLRQLPSCPEPWLPMVVVGAPGEGGPNPHVHPASASCIPGAYTTSWLPTGTNQKGFLDHHSTLGLSACTSQV